MEKSVGQQRIAWAEKHALTLQNDEERLAFLINIASEYQDSLNEESTRLLEAVNKESIEKNLKGLEAASILSLSYLYADSGKTEKMTNAIQRGRELIKYKTDLGTNYFGRSAIFLSYALWFKGDFSEAFKQLFEGIKLCDPEKNVLTAGWLYYALGVFNSDIGDRDNSNTAFTTAIRYFEKVNYEYGMARAKNGLATNLIAAHKPDEAEQLLNFSLGIYCKLGITAGESRALHDLAQIKKLQHKIEEAIEAEKKSLDIRIQTNHRQGTATSTISLGELYLQKGNKKEALRFLNEGVKLAENLENKSKSALVHRLLSDFYKSENDATRALHHLEIYLKLQEDLHGNNVTNTIKKEQARFEKEKAEQEAIIHRLKNVELKEAYEEIEKKNKELFLLSLVASETNNAIVIMDPQGKLEWINQMFTRFSGLTLEDLINKGVTSIFQLSAREDIRTIFHEALHSGKPISYESLHTSKTGENVWLINTLTPVLNINGEIKNMIIIASDITARRNSEEIIRQKNKDITDSINYARRIQRALLPGKSSLQQAFEEHFVFYKPKDIVSGDFYWSFHNSEYSFMAAADCTGHGVPGAFMSMIGVNKLNELVKEKNILAPANILNELRKEIIKSLNPEWEEKNYSENLVMDGMDISLLRLNKKTNEITVAAANNPVWMFIKSDSGFTVSEHKPCKFPVGAHFGPLESFTQEQYQLNSGDLVVMFTDGFADQFGGPKGKKFKYKSLMELLKNNAGKNLQDVKSLLNLVLKNWQNNYEQIDDILISGFRIK